MKKSLPHEPLLHFFVIGLIVFLLDFMLSPSINASREIIIDNNLKNELAEKFFSATKREPLPKELQQMIEGWIQQEVLYREGIAMGLDRSDGMIRERIISTVRALTLNNVNTKEPLEQDLLDYYERNQDKYLRPRRYDYEHIIVGKSGTDSLTSANALLKSLRSNQDPKIQDHRLMTTRKRSATQLAAIFGKEFPRQLESMQVGSWQLLHSHRGVHVIKLISVEAEGVPDFEKILERVKDDWLQEQRLKRAASRYSEMRAKYLVVNDGSKG